MTRDIPTSVVNGTLALGVALALAVAIGFTFSRHDYRGPILSRQAPPRATYKVAGQSIHLLLPPPVLNRPAPVAAPYEPPAPPMNAAVAPTPSESPTPPAAFSAADLRPPQLTPGFARASSPAAPAGDRAVTVRPGDPVPALRTVKLEQHEVHAIPNRDVPVHRVTVVGRPGGPRLAAPRPAAPPPRQRLARRESAPPARHEAPKHAAAKTPLQAQGGPNIKGPAVVTAALELNVDGRPLKLYGLKRPPKSDLCAPSPAYAARSCPDASRQALAAHLGHDGPVACRILAVGGRSALPAVCSDNHGHDLGTYLVRHGFALAAANDILDYSAAEKQAKAAHRGLWRYR